MPSLMNGVASHLSNSFMRVSKRIVLPRLPDLRANAAQIMLHASGSDDESCLRRDARVPFSLGFGCGHGFQNSS